MDLELKALKDDDILELTFLPKGKTAIDYKWVFKLEFHADVNLERCKGRVVAKVYT